MVRHMVLVVLILSGLSALGKEKPLCVISTYADGSITHVGNCSMWGYKDLESAWGSEGNGGGDLPIFLNQPVNVDALDDVQAEDELPYDSVDCDNANGNPKLCTVEPDEPDYTPPEECGRHADGSITDCCGALMETSLIQGFAEAAQRAADETDGKTSQLTKPEALERLDVPAVHQCTTKVPGWMVCPEYRLTCTDKSRILLTSEDGKKWCHKVQQ